MHYTRSVVISLVAAPMLLISCTDDYYNSEENPLTTGSKIDFSASEVIDRGVMSRRQETPDTFSLYDESDPSCTLHCETFTTPLASMPSRVSPTTQAAQIEQIGVIAEASWFEPRLMNNDLYTRGDDGVYRSDNVRYWIDDADAFVDFYAFAPYRPTGLTLPATKGQTTLTYTVPASSDRQADLMLAVSKGVKADYGQAVRLSFRHLLAGIRVNLTYPSGAKVTDLTFSGLYNSGTLDFSAGNPAWTPGADRNLTVSSGEIGQFAQFMVLPQTITESQPVNLSITVDYGDDGERTYTRALTAGEWQQGINTIYNITITNYSFTLTQTTPADAHYVMYKTSVEAKNVPAGTGWTLTAAANDGADVTIQNEEDLNTFAQQGFWTDKLIDGTNQTSARGSNTLSFTGSGTFPVTIFMPENATEANRTVTLNIHINGKISDETPLELTQLHPAWTTSGFGWEQTDDNINGDYGFKWNRVLYYGYLYTSLGNNNTYRNYCQSVIDDNNASGYASVTTYTYGLIRQRYAIMINYGNLTDIGSRASGRTDGLSNTKGLFNFGGAAATNSFVATIESILKTESGHTTEKAFRLGNGADNEAPAPSGDPITGSTAVGECMKKNRYNLRRAVSSEGDVSLTPVIADADIVWYMPAVDQFGSVPTQIVDGVNSASCWSSTCVDDRANSYLGNGSQADRLTVHSIRAVRNRP